MSTVFSPQPDRLLSDKGGTEIEITVLGVRVWRVEVFQTAVLSGSQTGQKSGSDHGVPVVDDLEYEVLESNILNQRHNVFSLKTDIFALQ